MQKITPFLWFDDKAEEAATFYTSIFKNSKVVNIARFGDAGAQVSGRPKGTVMTVAFQLDGQEFVALNGGPQFKFTEAISFVVNCQTQEEVDEYWKKLSDGGQEVQCGWLKGQQHDAWCFQLCPYDNGKHRTNRDHSRRRRRALRFPIGGVINIIKKKNAAETAHSLI
jgi:predicted 3-demethylubiquinone-9 3-methyltransferase (glyoxalase superfamily)